MIVGVLSLSGCGDSADNEADSPDAVLSPMECLDAAGLSNVEERASDFWRGHHDSPFYQVSIQRLASQAEATDLAANAVDVYAASSGVYVVTGPAKPSAGGLVDDDEAAAAESLVAEIAGCVGG